VIISLINQIQSFQTIEKNLKNCNMFASKKDHIYKTSYGVCDKDN